MHKMKERKVSSQHCETAMNERVELPIEISDVLTNPFISNRLSILKPHKETREWFLSNFTNYWACKNPIEHIEYWSDLLYHSAYRFCPFLFEGVITRELVDKSWKDGIIQFVIDAIDTGHYIYMNINATCIPQYKKTYENFMHDIMLYGYDNAKKVILAIDFFDSIYGVAEIPFETFEKAYIIEGLSKADFIGGLNILKFRESSYQFQIEECIKGLEDYLYSRNTQVKSILNELDNDESYYGLECYNSFLYYLEEIKKQDAEIDMRQFHYFYVHKVIMRQRVEYLIQENYLKKDSNEILENVKKVEKDFLVMRNLILKNTLCKNASIYDKLSGMLRELRQKEEKVITSLVDALKES